MKLVASQWLLCAFTRDFPSRTAERVFDWLFLDNNASSNSRSSSNFFDLGIIDHGSNRTICSTISSRGGGGGGSGGGNALLYFLLAFFRSASETILTGTAELDECVECVRRM